MKIPAGIEMKPEHQTRLSEILAQLSGLHKELKEMKQEYFDLAIGHSYQGKDSDPSWTAYIGLSMVQTESEELIEELQKLATK